MIDKNNSYVIGRLTSQSIMSIDQEGRITLYERKYSAEEIKRVLLHIEQLLLNKTDKIH